MYRTNPITSVTAKQIIASLYTAQLHQAECEQGSDSLRKYYKLVNFVFLQMDQEEEKYNQQPGSQKREGRMDRQGRPDFQVFNLSPWEAITAPAVSLCLSSERHLQSAVAAGPFISEHNYLCKWRRVKLAPHKQTGGPEDCEQTTH